MLTACLQANAMHSFCQNPLHARCSALPAVSCSSPPATKSPALPALLHTRSTSCFTPVSMEGRARQTSAAHIEPQRRASCRSKHQAIHCLKCVAAATAATHTVCSSGTMRCHQQLREESTRSCHNTPEVFASAKAGLRLSLP